jgi:hypothetical protein
VAVSDIHLPSRAVYKLTSLAAKETVTRQSIRFRRDAAGGVDSRLEAILPNSDILSTRGLCRLSQDRQ